MKLKFRTQQYQADAADAVARVFEGQPRQDSFTYLRDLGVQKKGKQGTEALFAHSDEAEGYANAPVQLSDSQLLSNIKRVQAENQITESTELCAGMGACQLDVEMETGTGKTYVYTKTMLELNRLYGWTKFIIVVPSVAIREGVAKSLQTTDDHFHDQYGKSVKSFIYNSDRLNELDSFSRSSDVMCMIINMQAFNASMKEGAANKAARIIFDERDEFGSRRPIDVIAANRPIVIVDEPQKMGKKGGATQKGIERFNPLFVLNYSATHKEKHDLVYVLDALDAFNQRLVKRIEVKGFKLKNMRGTDGYLYLKDIIVSRNKAPEAVIEFKQMSAGGTIRKVTQKFGEGDDIYLATNEPYLEAYRGYVIASGNDGVVPPQDGRPGYVRFLNDVVIQIGEVLNDSAREDMQRLQIRETIRSHIQKEESLFKRGIKCLSLFFIDEVAKYRDITGNGETVGYGKVFEEEYEIAVRERLGVMSIDDELDGEYARYLRRDDAHDVHGGYFSIDKKGAIVESKAEKKAEREDGIGINDDDAKRAYDLILKDKERLLSLDEPVRFIFSHSALREGWDNPNVFQICTLKESGSETSKRQEVGRGMRLCVDQTGERQDVTALGEADVHKVNLLTVIASESYEDYVGDLQSGIKSTLRARPTKVGADFFSGRNVVVDDEVVSFDKNQSAIIYAMLQMSGYLDGDTERPSEKFREQVREGGFVEYAAATIPALDGDAKKAVAVQKMLESVYEPNALDGMIEVARHKETKNKLNDNFRRKEFQELWSRINRMSAYTVRFDDEELRTKAVSKINRELSVSPLRYEMKWAGQKGKVSRADLDAGLSFGQARTVTEDIDFAAACSVKYDLVGEVAQAAAITRRSAAEILSRIDKNVFNLFKLNPEEFIRKVGKLIIEEKATMVVEHVSYRMTDQTFDSTIFTERMPESASKAYASKKNIQDFVFPDSKGERQFAEDLDAADEVVVYAKLPRSFAIPTPVGKYAPDWAIAFKQGSVKHVFFVAETKGSMSTMDLSTTEQTKIECAKKLFNELSTNEVRYHNVATYSDLLNVMQGIE